MEASILFSLAVLFALWGGYTYLGYRSSKKEWRNKVENWYGTQNERQSFIVVLGNRFDQTDHAQHVRERLLQANLPLNTSEFYAILIVGGMGIAFMFATLFNVGFPLNIVIAIVLVEICRRALFYFRQNKYQERLNEQLPDVCRTLANATRSGMTLNQAIGLVARELDAPAKTEFQRLYNELLLGVDFDRALQHLQKRIPGREFKLFVATLLIQKKAGGNLYAVLDEMAQTLDERKLLLQEIKTMTAEQKYVAYIVPVLPIILVLMMNTVIEGFIDPLFSFVGFILSILFVTGIILTFFLVRKVTNIRV